MPIQQTFVIKAQNGKYLIDGDVAPNLELISGKTYEFDLSDPSLSSHPWKLNLSGKPWGRRLQTVNLQREAFLHMTTFSFDQRELAYQAYVPIIHLFEEESSAELLGYITYFIPDQDSRVGSFKFS